VRLPQRAIRRARRGRGRTRGGRGCGAARGLRGGKPKD
jgi:hypothetical protein